MKLIGKKVKGRKRSAHIDTDGRALVLDPQPAGMQDRDRASSVLRLSRRSFSFITKGFADAGYAGDKPARAPIIAAEIVPMLPEQGGFAVNPSSEVTGRFFTWFSCDGRLSVESEASHAVARAILYAAAVARSLLRAAAR